LLWTLQRQPPGPEREIQQLIAKVLARGKPA
jgi:hypothetical protein